MGDHDRIATTGFSKMSDRQIGLWDTGSLNNVKTTTIDQSSGVVMPFWSDNNILFLGMCTVRHLHLAISADAYRSSRQGVRAHTLAQRLYTDLQTETAISVTTSMRTIRSSHSQNTSPLIPNGACASCPVVPSTSPNAKSPARTRSTAAPSSQSRSSFPER